MIGSDVDQEEAVVSLVAISIDDAPGLREMRKVMNRQHQA